MQLYMLCLSCVGCSILALPLGQHLFWVLPERGHLNMMACKINLPPRRVKTPSFAQANGGLSIRAGRCTETQDINKGPSGRHCFGRRSLPKEVTSAAAVPAHRARGRLKRQVGERRCFGQCGSPRGRASTATVPAHQTKALKYKIQWRTRSWTAGASSMRPCTSRWAPSAGSPQRRVHEGGSSKRA